MNKIKQWVKANWKQIKMFIGGVFIIGLPMMIWVVYPLFSYVERGGKALLFAHAVVNAFVVAITFGHILDFKTKLCWKDSRGQWEFNGVLMGALGLLVNIIWAFSIN